MKANRAMLAACLLLPLAAGCRSGQVTVGRVAGTWVLDRQSRYAAPAGGSAELQLKADGHFMATTLPPNLLGDSDLVAGRAITGSGSWMLSHEGDEDRIRLTFEQMQGMDKAHLPYGAEVFAEPQKRDVVLFFYTGDPDEDQRISFSRQSR